MSEEQVTLDSYEVPGSLWHPKLSEPLYSALKDVLEEGEALLGLAETGSQAGHPEGAYWWFVLTNRRRGLLAATKGEPAPISAWREIDATQTLSVQRRLTRDEFVLGPEILFVGTLVGGGTLRQLVEMSGLPGHERLIEAAVAHLEDKKHLSGAQALLLKAWSVMAGPEPASQSEEERAFLAMVLLRRAQTFLKQDKEGEIVNMMAEAARLRPDDDFLKASEALGLKGESWWLPLVAALESVGHAAPASRIWAMLREKEPGQDVYTLQHARAMLAQGDQEQALSLYDLFLSGRSAESDFALVEIAEDALDDPELVGSDAERAAALLESSQLCEAMGQHEDALRRATLVVREAPWWTPGYLHLLRLTQAQNNVPQMVARAVQILRLMHPDKAKAIAAELGQLPSAPVNLSQPITYQAMEEEQHKQTIHPREEDASTLAQKWVGGLVSESRDVSDIRRHCKRMLARENPTRRQILTEVAALLKIPTPACYISFGTSGLEALQDDGDPIILLGAVHLKPEEDRYLQDASFCFAVATQLAHIRSGHLILTSSEFWSAFGHKAFEAGMTVISLIPVASWVGKLTDAFAVKWLNNLQKKVQGEWVLKALHLAQEQVKQGAMGTGAESALGTALEKARGEMGPASSGESMVKEQLASFARGAMYSADRVGLLACDDLTAAVEAMFLLSPQASEELLTLHSHGLAAVLSKRQPDGELRYQEMALRLGELFKFALSDEYEALRDLCLPEASDDLGPEILVEG